MPAVRRLYSHRRNRRRYGQLFRGLSIPLDSLKAPWSVKNKIRGGKGEGRKKRVVDKLGGRLQRGRLTPSPELQCSYFAVDGSELRDGLESGKGSPPLPLSLLAVPRERRIYFAGKKAITRLRSLARESEVKKGPEWLRDGNGGGGTLDEARLQLFTDDDSKRNYGDTNQLHAVENAPQWQAVASPPPPSAAPNEPHYALNAITMPFSYAVAGRRASDSARDIKAERR